VCDFACRGEEVWVLSRFCGGLESEEVGEGMKRMGRLGSWVAGFND